MPSTIFKDTTKGTGNYATYYIWSLAANWTNGVPGAGYDASYTATGSSTDIQADDIASLTLNSLSLAATATATEELFVTGSLTLGALSLKGVGSIRSFLVADALVTGSPTTITVNGPISVTGMGILEAFGSGASVFVYAADPGGMQYWTGGSGGLLYLRGAPAASSIFNFNGTGAFAFANPGASIAAALTGVGAGDSVELPATKVFTVTYGSNSIAVSTNAGVYNFTNVVFPGVIPNDFASTPDYTTGLEKITFLSSTVLKANAAATSGPYAGDYLWSNAANWSTGAVPASGGDVVLNPAASTPVVDDLANTSVNRLIFPTTGGFLTVNGALTIGTLQLDPGVSSQNQTLLASTEFTGGATTATITINNMINVGGGYANQNIQAIGVGATVVVNGVDAGDDYLMTAGGRIILNAVPSGGETSASLFSVAFINPTGTLVLTTLGAPVASVTTIHLAMGVTSGGSVELPGSTLISSMSDDDQSPETIITDYGTYVFPGWYDSSGPDNFGITDFIATRDYSTDMLKLTAETPGAADNPQHNHDANGDGFADIIFQNTSGQTAVWEMNGLSIADASFLPNPGGTWALVATGDFTGHGKSDFLFQDATGAIAEWLMNGDSVAAGLYLPNPGPTWKLDTTGDFNSDGMSDVALQGSDGSVAIWEMNGANIIANGAAVVANPGTAWKPVASGDFWNDGKSELVLQNSNGSLAFWGFNDSGSGPVLDTTHTAQLSLNPGAAWALKGTGDFNGDTMSDLVFQNSTTGQVAIWEMNQTGLLSPTSFATLASPGVGWEVVQIGDFNGDGMSDVLFQNTASGALGVWIMNGLSQANTSALAADPGTAWHVIG